MPQKISRKKEKTCSERNDRTEIQLKVKAQEKQSITSSTKYMQTDLVLQPGT